MAAQNQDLTTCEQYCKKLEREELAKQTFEVLQTDFTYNSTTNTYTGTYMNIKVAGQIYLIEKENILLTQNTNTIIANIAYDGTNLVCSITTEQKTVGQVSALMASRTFTSVESTCSYTIPIQFDGKDTSSEESCSSLKDLYDITPIMVKMPNISYNLDTKQTTISGLVVLEALGKSFKKTLPTQTFDGNTTIIKIYGTVDNFELIGYNATSPSSLKAYCRTQTNINGECAFYYPFSTFMYAAFRKSYDVELSWAESVNVYDWNGQGLQIEGMVNSRNQKKFGWVRAGFKKDNMQKIPFDVRLAGATTLNPSEGFGTDENNVLDGIFAGDNSNWIGADFRAVVGNAKNKMYYKVNQYNYDKRAGIEQQSQISGASISDNVAKLFFIKNNVGLEPIIDVSLSTSEPTILWLNYD